MASSSAASTAGPTSEAGQINVKVKTMEPQTYGPLAVTPMTTVGEFKLRLQQETRIPVERQRLIFRGRALLDDQRLVDQHVEDGVTLHLVERPVTQSQQAAPEAAPRPSQPHAAGSSPAGQQQGGGPEGQVTWGQITIENHGVGPADLQQFMNGMMGGLGAAGLQGMVTGPIGIQINAETLLPGGAQGAGNPSAAGQHQGVLHAMGAQRAQQGVPPSHLLTSVHNYLNYTAHANDHPFPAPRPVMAPIAPGRRHEVDQRAMQAARGVLDGAPLPDHVRRSIESAFGSANISRAQAQQAAASAASASASAGPAPDPPMGFPASSGVTGASNGQQASRPDSPDPPRRRRGTVDGNPAAPITASVALGHLLSVAENQMRDNMLPAVHAAAEALRNFTGLIDDADQRAVFRQRDPGLDAAFAPAARARPAPNSAADAPTQLREQVAAAYSNMAHMLPVMHELMNALGLHYWAMRGLPAPFLAAITTAINPYVAIGELRAAMGEPGQAAGPAQPPQPAQPPIHPWTAAALPAGLLPGHLQAQQARQAGAGAAPNPVQQPFDIVAFAGAAAAEAEAAAAAAGAAADYADVALAQSGARADATARVLQESLRRFPPRNRARGQGPGAQASTSAEGQAQAAPRPAGLGPSAAGLPPLGLGGQSRTPGPAPAARARQAGDRPDEQVIQQLGLRQDPASGRWILDAPQPSPAGAPPAPAARNPFLPGTLQTLPFLPRTLQEDATQWIALITNSHRLYTSTRQHNTHELNRLLRVAEADPFGAGPPPPEVAQALRNYLAELSRVPTPALPAVPHFFAPPEATPDSAFPGPQPHGPEHLQQAQTMNGNPLPFNIPPLLHAQIGNPPLRPGEMPSFPPASANPQQAAGQTGARPTPATVQQQSAAGHQPAAAQANAPAPQQPSGAGMPNGPTTATGTQPTASPHDARHILYQQWMAQTQAGLHPAGGQAPGTPVQGARVAPEPHGTPQSAAQPSGSAGASSQPQPQQRASPTPQQAHRQTQTRMLPGNAGMAQMMQMLQTGAGGMPVIAQGMQPVAMGMGPTVVRLGTAGGPAITLVPAAPNADQPNQASQLGSVNIGGVNGLTLRPDGPTRMRAEVAGHQLTVQLDMQPLISALNGAFNQIYLSPTVAGAATPQGPPERPQEGIAAAAGALMGQLTRQLVPEAIVSMMPGMTPADLGPRAPPNGPGAPVPGMDQVQGELDEVQVRIEPNEGSPESVQAIAPVLRALAGSLGLPANAFNGMLESIAGQAQGITRGPDQQQGSSSQPAGTSRAGAAPDASRTPTQTADAPASQSQTSPPPPSSSSTVPPAADQTPRQGSAASTGSAAAAAPTPPTPGAPQSPLGATWQALLQALGSEPQPPAAPAASSATHGAPTQSQGPTAQPGASLPAQSTSPPPPRQPQEQTSPFSGPDNSSPPSQPQRDASEGLPSNGPSRAPTLASVKTEEIPESAAGSGPGSSASSAAGFFEGDTSAPGQPAPVIAGGLGSAGVQRAAEAAVYEGMRRAMAAQGIDIPADVDENTVRREMGEDQPFASLLSHPIAVPQTPDGSLPSSPLMHRFTSGAEQAAGPSSLHSNGPAASRLQADSASAVTPSHETAAQGSLHDQQPDGEAAGRPSSSGSGTHVSAGKGLGGLGLPNRKGKAPMRKPGASTTAPSQHTAASTAPVPSASAASEPPARQAEATGQAVPHSEDSSLRPPLTTPSAAVNTSTAAADLHHSASAGIEQVDAQPPPRQQARNVADGGLAGLMGQLLQGMANPSSSGTNGRGADAGSLGGALNQLLQGIGTPPSPTGTSQPQSTPTSSQQQTPSSTSSRIPESVGASSSSGSGGTAGVQGVIPSQQQQQQASTRNPGGQQPAGFGAEAGGLGGALGQLLQGLGNAPDGAGATASQGGQGGALGGGLGAMMGQMLRNPQMQQMALGLASQLEGQFGGGAQQSGDAASNRTQPTLDLGGMMGAVSQMLAGNGGSAQSQGTGASTRRAPRDSELDDTSSPQNRIQRPVSPARQSSGAPGSADLPSAGLLDEALRDYPPEEAAHWRTILQQDAARAGNATPVAPRSAVYRAGSRQSSAAGAGSSLESLFS